MTFFNKEKWLEFIDTHCLIKLNILRQENDKNWRYLANQQYDSFTAAMLSSDINERRTICANYSRANQQQ
jgi:hypothetical protein